MDVFFENKYMPSAEYLHEFYMHYFFSKRSPLVKCSILFLAFVSVHLLFILTGAYLLDISFLLILFSLWLFLLIVTVIKFKRTKRIMLMRVLETHHSIIPEITIRITEEEIYTSASHSEGKTAVSLSSITKIHETKNYIVLSTPAGVSFSFSKNGFTWGNPEELKKFFRARGLKC